MPDYITPLTSSPHFDDPKYILGMKEGLDAAQQIADDLGMPLAANPSFDELYRVVSDKWAEFEKSGVLDQ